jgi:hypothetical protein
LHDRFLLKGISGFAFGFCAPLFALAIILMLMAIENFKHCVGIGLPFAGGLCGPKIYEFPL